MLRTQSTTHSLHTFSNVCRSFSTFKSSSFLRSNSFRVQNESIQSRKRFFYLSFSVGSPYPEKHEKPHLSFYQSLLLRPGLMFALTGLISSSIGFYFWAKDEVPITRTLIFFFFSYFLFILIVFVFFFSFRSCKDVIDFTIC